MRRTGFPPKRVKVRKWEKVGAVPTFWRRKAMAGPLEGLRILDFTTLLPGPYATMTLSDLGADVLRVVSGSRPDLAAFLPPFLPGTNLSCAIAYLGRAKRCMALNLKDSRAIAIVRRLVAEHDIVIEQF